MTAPLVTAIRTLTIVPIPGHEPEDRTASLPYFPLVGLIIGGILYVLLQGCTLLWSEYPLLGGLMVTFAGVIITGALHLDGIADVADGFGGGKIKERILEIFKDSRHGTFGVVAIVFDLLARVLLVGWCMKEGHSELIVTAAVFSRTAMAWSCAILPYARSGGGTAESFISGKIPAMLAVTTIGIIAVMMLAFGPVPHGTILLAAAIPVQLFLFQCLKKIGGITGDCLGTVNEAGEIGVLFAGCIVYG